MFWKLLCRNSKLIYNADEVFFYGVNSKSEYLITRIARGPNQGAEAWIYLKLSNGKVYQLQETSGFQQSCCDKRAFTCGGLQIHYLSPMRRWRIFFNGVLRETDDNDSTVDRKIHVKFAVMWRASSDTFDYTSDINTTTLATGLAKAKWSQFLPPLEKFYSAMDCYAQTGVIAGTINIEGYDDELKIYLFGEKIRFMGNSSLLEDAKFLHLLGHVSKNGRFIHIAEVSIGNIVKNLTLGFVSALSGALEVLEGDKNVLINFADIDENDIVAKFYVEDDEFILNGTLSGKENNLHISKGLDGKLTIDCLKFDFNEGKGMGVVINGKIKKSPKRTLFPEVSHVSPSVVPLVVPFSEKICQNPDITGGKGSSLGKLTELSNDFKSFIVPNGVVVTTAAYEMFVTDEILKEIKKLEGVLYSDKVDETKTACQRVVEKVTNSTMPEPILQAVAENLEKMFPDKKHVYKFAVRSSATGEDTEQMSAAGQMDTFLGVEGMSEIMTAIKKCWASQFGFIAVQYKRQNGQIINSPMAVVVQQMIPCDVAGVLFTCDPLSGNPTKMSITANYGLGESVVSGSEEPDALEIERESNETVRIKNKIIGSKQRRIILKDDGGTEVEEVQEQDKQTCCLSDNMALRLAQLALKIEKSYKSYRDIEWGFWNNNLYIFQSRPVTSGSGETDFEIEHEFDGPLRNEDDYFTVGHIGEVMPGATSPLGIEVITKFFNTVFQKSNFVGFHQSDFTKYYPRGIQPWYNHMMFCTIDLFHNLSENSEQVKANCVGLFGRSQYTFKESMKRLYRILYGAKKTLYNAVRHYEKYNIPLSKFQHSQDLFNHLMYCCTDLTQAFNSHLTASESSSVLNMYIFLILQKAVGEINTDVYSDFANLITTRDVECSDVPGGIEKLALSIIAEKRPEDFNKMELDDALQWLETSSTSAGKKYREFLERHGHRCLKEFDIRSVTWKNDPKSLIKTLQNLVLSVKKDKSEEKTKEVTELISNLKAPVSFLKRLLLRIILPMSRRAVNFRELSKTTLMQGLYQWRRGYRKLAKLMVSEGRIPDEDLIYFMTMEEIKELLETRSPKIISKANHRRRRQPVLEKYIFPEIMKGFPVPMNMEKKIVVTGDNFSMTGIPVSAGTATGFVRVALDLDEASLLQPGEILVTYCTDIGWSPYFPMLAGVVTELGGLISHGAVVSREYGLPCIAGMHGATQQFQTGDYVLMDGNKGVLQKIPKPEDS
ncbi:putative phosphotransferase YvkC like protein [Argiope bruennichi]|uniref:Putative phosphotransferase YvkC like protein n=1 Tax=Argiope bruennichi TaxID=94029 RepID=A0A8T0FR76_ARGBR|nr:putative phosphotransferase YvkC like protein [Argiope bruennichi]